MQKISVIIICKNEEDTIGRCLQSLHGLTDDVVVLDNGSTDSTKEIIRKNNARLAEESWEGFGKTKNKATVMAKYDWVLNLDADEAVDEELKNSILSVNLANENEVFNIRFKNFLGNTWLRFGEWGTDMHIRIFNRKNVKWDDAIVHENLVLSPGIKIRKLKGAVLHYTMKNAGDYAEKMVKYALLNAEKYARQGKRSSWVKVWLAPLFAFLKYYIFKLGFLDGYAGFICARMTSYYTFVKYARLKELENTSRPG
jgi:glycosyltransferase involved in cell wall biosynthesis